MSAISIRDADLSRDTEAFRAFILGSQHYEYAFEPNRRLDPPVADEHLAKLHAFIAERGGAIFAAQDETGAAIGWGVVGECDDEIFVVAEQRRFALITELFVAESARGAGIGRALIGTCEDWARARGILLMQIGVLAENSRARRVYRGAGYTDYAVQLRKPLAPES